MACGAEEGHGYERQEYRGQGYEEREEGGRGKGRGEVRQAPAPDESLVKFKLDDISNPTQSPF